MVCKCGSRGAQQTKPCGRGEQNTHEKQPTVCRIHATFSAFPAATFHLSVKPVRGNSTFQRSLAAIQEFVHVMDEHSDPPDADDALQSGRVVEGHIDALVAGFEQLLKTPTEEIEVIEGEAIRPWVTWKESKRTSVLHVEIASSAQVHRPHHHEEQLRKRTRRFLCRWVEHFSKYCFDRERNKSTPKINAVFDM